MCKINSLHKRKQMTVETSVLTRTLCCILHNDLKLDRYRFSISHALTPRLREICLTCRAALLHRFKGKKYWNIFFTDKKIFSIKEKINCQNDHMYVRSCYESTEKMPWITRMRISYLWWFSRVCRISLQTNVGRNSRTPSGYSLQRVQLLLSTGLGPWL